MGRKSGKNAESKQFLGPIFLILAAMVWGVSFVAQDLASDSVEAFTFNGLRMTLGGAILIPVVAIKNRGSLFLQVPEKKDKIHLLKGGIVCGLLVFCAAYFQQAGIEAGTSAGKSGFITAMYVVLVPLVGIFVGKKVRLSVWACVLCAVTGLYFLCMASFDDGFSGIVRNLSFEKGDFLTFLCAICFTFHIIAVDHFAPGTDGVFLSAIQFLFAGILGIVFMFLLESPTWEGVRLAGGAILYAAVFSCGVGYTFQILGQSSTPPAIASLLMCLESVFAVLSDALFLKTPMTAEEICGCILMFAAISASNLVDFFPTRKKEKR